jgi:iron-sulfur cluster assembly accessory protein
MSVSLTENAVSEIRRVMSEQNLPEGTLLRVGVSGGGCSGFEYRLGFEEDGAVDAEKDSVRELHGLQVVVDRKSALYLDGTEIDFHQGLERRGFVFNNPNAVKTCGCGSSFQA